MMNIQSAIRQMRTARRLGKLSLDSQNRIMRKLRPESEQAQSAKHWERMMALRASIEKEIRPVLEAKREAEHETFQVRYVSLMDYARKHAAAVPVASKPRKPALVGDEYTPEWWKAAELREREARKAGTLVD